MFRDSLLTLSLSQAASAGATKSYSTPAAPKTPEVPDAASLAKELEAYDAYVHFHISLADKVTSSRTNEKGSEDDEGRERRRKRKRGESAREAGRGCCDVVCEQ
jgi:hypothetical protein